MKKYLFAWIFCLCSATAWAQECKVYTEKVNSSTINFYVDNDFACPITLKIAFTTALNICPAEEQFVLVESNTSRRLLFTLTPCDTGKEWRYAFKYWYYWGDLNLENYNAEFAYTLPYPKGEEYKVGQGYFGKYSHQDRYALDFFMPEGTEICAMRGGTVFRTKSDSNIGGADLKFANDANYVYIYHNDGTIGVYLHFKQNGVLVNVGDKVKKGQVIAYSGNTGYSSTPHLHIEIRLPDTDGKKTVEPKFVVGGETLEIKQGVYYKNK